MGKDKSVAADVIEDEIEVVDDGKILDNINLDEYLSPEELAALKDDDEASGLDEILADEDAAIAKELPVVEKADEKPEAVKEYKQNSVRMDVKPVEDYDNKIADFNRQLDDLVEKLDNGDISL